MNYIILKYIIVVSLVALSFWSVYLGAYVEGAQIVSGFLALGCLFSWPFVGFWVYVDNKQDRKRDKEDKK